MPPPLVLPSEIRRNSLANKSRSASPSSAHPLQTQDNSKSRSVSYSEFTGRPNVDNRSKSMTAAITAPSQPSFSTRHGNSESTKQTHISKHQLKSSQSYSTPTPRQQLQQQLQHQNFYQKQQFSSPSPSPSSPSKLDIPKTRSKSTSNVNSSANSLSTKSEKHVRGLSMSKSMSVSDLPVKKEKSSFGQKLRKAFSFGKKSDEGKTQNRSQSRQASAPSDRTFSLSFARKSRSNTMNSAILPSHGKFRSMTMTSASGVGADRRSSAANIHAFEGFESVVVNNKRRSSRAKSELDLADDDDAVSVHSNTSVSSYATLKKMSKNLFSKSSVTSSPSIASNTTSTLNVPATQSRSDLQPGIAIEAPMPMPSFPSPGPTSQSSPVSVSSNGLTRKTPSPTSIPTQQNHNVPSSSRSMISIVGDAPEATTLASTLDPSPAVSGLGSVILVEPDTKSASVPEMTNKVSQDGASDSLLVPPTVDVNAELEDDDDLNVADTVFPKNLDSLAVESIRSSLNRTKSLERRRSRRSTKSEKSINESEGEKPVEVHVRLEQPSISSPSSPTTTSPHGILKSSSSNLNSVPVKAATPNRRTRRQVSPSSIPSTPPTPSHRSFSSQPKSLPTTPTQQKTNEHTLKSSPSIQSIFDFGDSNINLDFDFTPAVAAGLDTEVKKYKSNLKSKPKDFSKQNALGQRQSSYNMHKSSSSNGSIAHNTKVSFSPRIIIYDTYDPVEYDRHAEPATCNRLNPMLAQQIREELNNLKMEMEVHAESRIYTHFF